jgi:hypothetical protein
LVIAASLVLLCAGPAGAITNIHCTNCHTAHNSENGLGRLFDSRDSTTSHNGDPQGSILRFIGCAGCHTNTQGGCIVADTPIVYNTDAYPPVALAGGNFYYAKEAPEKAHNCAGLIGVGPDPHLYTPPGFLNGNPDPYGRVPKVYASSGYWGPDTWPPGQKVTCAGMYGCHGDRSPGNDEYAAIKGAHHDPEHFRTDGFLCDGTTTGRSYRFLTGIRGVEQNGASLAASYEYGNGAGPTSGVHNGYFAVDDATRVNALLTATISFLCAECHGNFHTAAGMGTRSPWLRHPTDIAMPMVGPDGRPTEFAGYEIYNPLVPLGTSSPDTTSFPPDKIVICLSCHRAHGSPYNDLLRWKYQEGTGQADPSEGSCRTCHTGK